MKTIEQEAEEWCENNDNVYGFDAWIACAKFIQRWIPVSESPIPLQEQILVKMKDGKIFDAVKWPNGDILPWWSSSRDFKLIESNIVSWRRIELI